MNKQLTLGISLSLISCLAFAHPGHGLANGALESAYAGFMHPLTGWDHLLVMLAIGVWAAKLGGNARWQLPLTFVLVMTIGAVLGLADLSISGVETAIAASVMAMGLLLAINLPVSTAVRIGMVATFAVFHGMAHGVELNSQQGYAALGGMVLATALLHGVGLLLGSQRVQVAKWINASLAWGMVLIGGFLLIA